MFESEPWAAAAFGLAVPHLVIAAHFRSFADVPVRALSGAGWMSPGVAVDAYAPAPVGPPDYAVVLAGNLEGAVGGGGGVPVAPLAADASTPRAVLLALRLDLLGVPASALQPGSCWALVPQAGGGPAIPLASNTSDAVTGRSVILTLQMPPKAGGAFVLSACRSLNSKT